MKQQRDYTPTAVGLAVRAAREAQGPWLSQSRLGELAGVEPSTISRLEGGRARPSLPTLAKLAPHLRTTVAALLAGEVAAVEPAPLPPLEEARVALYRGPWPRPLVDAVLDLFAAYADDKRAMWKARAKHIADTAMPEVIVFTDPRASREDQWAAILDAYQFRLFDDLDDAAPNGTRPS